MYDTVDCYNGDETCEMCGEKPVENIHDGDLTGNKLTKLCRACFIKLSESTDK